MASRAADPGRPASHEADGILPSAVAMHRVEPGLLVDLRRPAEPFFEGGLVGDSRPQFEDAAVFRPEREHLAVAGPALVDAEPVAQFRAVRDSLHSPMWHSDDALPSPREKDAFGSR